MSPPVWVGEVDLHLHISFTSGQLGGRGSAGLERHVAGLDVRPDRWATAQRAVDTD